MIESESAELIIAEPNVPVSWFKEAICRVEKVVYPAALLASLSIWF